MSAPEWAAVALMVAVCVALIAGYPVALTLAGVSLMAAALGIASGIFDPSYLSALPSRIYGVMMNETLLAVPLFVYMGVMLERSGIAERLLRALSDAIGQRPGGLLLAVMLVGAVLAAATGIVGATVVTMGLISLPVMLKRNYDPALACGTICAAGTLGQIIPPSIVLVLLGDTLSTAYQQAQLKLGRFGGQTLSVGDLFAASLVPGLILVAINLVYLWLVTARQPALAPPAEETGQKISVKAILAALAPPLLLVVLVLGSIIHGVATPTEAAAIGAFGATLLAAKARELSLARLLEVGKQTALVSTMVFWILIGASVFSLVFRGYGGDDLVHRALSALPGGVYGALLIVMLVVFVLGFVLDFIEIVFVVVPLVAPTLLMLGVDPLWLGVMLAVNLQASFLTPPFGFALFYLRGVAPPSIPTRAIYRGVVPFIVIQLLLLLLLALFPALVSAPVAWWRS